MRIIYNTFDFDYESSNIYIEELNCNYYDGKFFVLKINNNSITMSVFGSKDASFLTRINKKISKCYENNCKICSLNNLLDEDCDNE